MARASSVLRRSSRRSAGVCAATPARSSSNGTSKRTVRMGTRLLVTMRYAEILHQGALVTALTPAGAVGRLAPHRYGPVGATRRRGTAWHSTPSSHAALNTALVTAGR